MWRVKFKGRLGSSKLISLPAEYISCKLINLSGNKLGVRSQVLNKGQGKELETYQANNRILLFYF